MSIQLEHFHVAFKEEIQSYKEQAKLLAGPIALLKMYATQTAQETARDAVQIFGGRGITRTGMGRFVEHVSSRIAAVIQ